MFRVKRMLGCFLPVLASFAIAVFVSNTALASVAVGGNGDVSPIDPTTWWENLDSMQVAVGLSNTVGTATLLVNSGSTISSGASVDNYISYDAGTTGVVTVDGSGSSWTMSSVWSGGYGGVYGYCNASDLYLGFLGNGYLNVTNGGFVSSHYTWIGARPGSLGVANVDGAGSTWNITSDYDFQAYGAFVLNVGWRGNGVLNITNGGAVHFTNVPAPGRQVAAFIGGVAGQGMVTVDGSGSTMSNMSLLLIGSTYNYLGFANSIGTLKISNGGLVETSSDVSGGLSPRTCVGGDTGFGEINFNGGTLTTNSLLSGTTGTLVKSRLTGTGTINVHGLVGGGGNGNLIFDGLDPTRGLNQTFTLNDVGQNITVNLTSQATADLGAGYAGNGTLTIRNGITVDSANSWLGFLPGSTGIATVDGSGSTWNIQGPQIYVGLEGTGTLNITNGGAVNVNGELAVGRYASGSAVNVDGAGSKLAYGYVALWNGSTLNVSDGGMLVSGNAGTVHFDGGILKTTGNSGYWLARAHIKERGVIFDTAGFATSITGPLEHSGIASIDGGVTKTGSGTLTLSGANTYTGLTSVSAGVLKLVDTTSDWTEAFKPIFTGGSATVGGGTLVFNYGSTFDDALALSSITAAINDGTISEAFHTPPLICSGNTATDTVTVLNTLFGDSNVDGSVNGTDLNAVLSYYNQSGQAWATGDFNFDGSVNGTDLNTVLSNYNQSLSSSTAAVPEPSTLLLMVLGLVGLLAARRMRACTHQ